MLKKNIQFWKNILQPLLSSKINLAALILNQSTIPLQSTRWKTLSTDITIKSISWSITTASSLTKKKRFISYNVLKYKISFLKILGGEINLKYWLFHQKQRQFFLFYQSASMFSLCTICISTIHHCPSSPHTRMICSIQAFQCATSVISHFVILPVAWLLHPAFLLDKKSTLSSWLLKLTLPTTTQLSFLPKVPSSSQPWRKVQVSPQSIQTSKLRWWAEVCRKVEDTWSLDELWYQRWSFH